MRVITACINTYKRPTLLKKNLLSLIKQTLPTGLVIKIIIVDNDVNKSAFNIVQEVINSNRDVCIKYLSEPEKNISLARNKAVKEADGDFILFIDDDGYADMNLLSEYNKNIEIYKPDGLFGNVIPYFDDGVPDWIKKGKFFHRAVQRTGEKTKYTRTGNCIIKTDLLKSIEGPFDPEYGLTGGEDINLFSKLQQNGANFIFCAEAIVYDFVPKDRACLSWLIKRTYRTGLTYTRNRIKNSRYKIFSFIWQILKSTTYLFISTLLTILSLYPKEKRIFWFFKIISNVGHIAGALGLKYYEYM